MDRRQRYCINCAARRGDVANPASRYFAAASRRRRVASAPVASASGAGATGGARASAVFFFVLLPIAVAVGVVVGRSGSDSDTDKVLAALRDGSIAPAAATADTAAGADTSKTVSDSLLTSDFTLEKGFTVMIGTLPIDGTDQAAADEAKSAAEDKGAEDVGIINPGDFTTDPDQGQDNYLLFAGEFEDRAAAEKALGDLKKDFPDAEVIGVDSGSAAGKTDSVGKVVAKTSHGTVHEVTAAPPSEEQVAHDTQIVNNIANQTGEDYTDLQQSLPDVTVVGGNPEDAPPLPTGAGD